MCKRSWRLYVYLYLDFYVLFPLKISTYIDFRKNLVIQIFCQKNYYIYIHSRLLKRNLWIRTLRIDSFPIAASSMQFRTCSARRSPDLWINNNLGKCVKFFFSCQNNKTRPKTNNILKFLKKVLLLLMASSVYAFKRISQ